jgi:Flp pilus assembly protein CpaB
MASAIDYYEILQVSPKADASVIDAAYRLLALNWHRDSNPGEARAAERIRLLNEAYAVLSDTRRREQYDQVHGASTAKRSDHASQSDVQVPAAPMPPSTNVTEESPFRSDVALEPSWKERAGSRGSALGAAYPERSRGHQWVKRLVWPPTVTGVCGILAILAACPIVAAFLTAKLGASNNEPGASDLETVKLIDQALGGGSKQEMIPVLVAARNLDQGTKLDKIEEQFVRRPFPKESVPPEFIDDPAQLKGQTLQRSLRVGSHITTADITPRNGIELPIDPKTGIPYKAISLRVAPETIVGGLVLPGSRVDVVSVERQTDGKTGAAMILQNVLVVAVDVNTSRPDDAGYIKNAQTVTLAVKQTEGMILALAQKRGDVMLMLRSPDDDNVNKNLKNLAK